MIDKLVEITVLDSVIHAQMLGDILNQRGIPHVIISYHDSAYNGVFQVSQGWGHVEAPDKYRDEIVTILQAVKGDQAQTE